MLKTTPIQKKSKENNNGPKVRHPEGCPIDGHQGYGCVCNPIRVSR